MRQELLQWQGWAGDQIAASIKPVLAVERDEPLAMAGYCLLASQKQVAARPQRIMKQRNDLPLQTRLEVDQQVAARDQIETRKRRIANNAVIRKDAHIAQLFDDAINAGLF